MITGIDVYEIIEEFHEDFQNHKILPYQYLRSKGFNPVVVNNLKLKDVHPEFQNGYQYLLTVPSLNTVGGLHHILLYKIDDLYGVLDPNNGNYRKHYYSINQEKEESLFSHTLKSWVVDLKIPLKIE